MSTTTTKRSVLNVNDIQPNDIFSEVCHYVAVNPAQGQYKNINTGDIIQLNKAYVESFLKTADQFTSEVKVGREDKYWTAKQIQDASKKGEDVSNVRVGDVRVEGIRTIWENIHSTQVFTVCFRKADTVLSAKKYQERINEVVSKAVQEIESVKAQKRGVASAATVIIEDLVKNPILNFEPGESRVLRGYKIQFTSRDGRYDCIDMDLENGQNVRPVNINTLEWLVFDGVKYIVE